MSLHFISITSSALALHCCNAHAKINRKIENSTPCKIVTHEDFNFKLGTRDYVADITHHTTLGSNRPSGGFPPNRGNITAMWLFWLYCFFLDPAPRSNRRTDCYAEWLKWRVSAQGRSFWGSGRWVTFVVGRRWFNSQRETELNWTEQFSSVEFSFPLWIGLKIYHQNFLLCNNNEITACIADLFNSFFCTEVYAVVFFKVVQQQTICKVGNSIMFL